MLSDIRRLRLSQNSSAIPPLPGTGGYAQLTGFGGGLSRATMTEETAFGLPAFFRAVEIKAETQSHLPFHVYGPDGDEADPTPVIISQPDPNELRHTTLNKIISSLILYGESYSLLQFQDVPANSYVFSLPVALRPIHPSQVIPEFQKDGSLLYSIGGTYYDPSTILRISSGISLPGSRTALQRLGLFAGVLDQAHQQVEYGRKTFREGGAPSGILKIDRKMSDIDPSQMKDMLGDFMAAMSNNSRTPVAFPNDVTYQAIGGNAEESQLIQSRKFTLSEIANAVGIPGYFLGAEGASMTYSNVAQENVHLLQFSFYELQAIEDAFTSLLPPGYTTKFNVAGMFRMDPAGQAGVLALLVGAGIITPDEARGELDRLPLPNGIGAILNPKPVAPSPSSEAKQ